jgi:hypothetical protein
VVSTILVVSVAVVITVASVVVTVRATSTRGATTAAEYVCRRAEVILQELPQFSGNERLVGESLGRFLKL